MPTMTLSHFEAAFLFALFVSVVMSITTKKSNKERLNYGVYCFVCFIVAVFGIGWAMKFGHG